MTDTTAPRAGASVPPPRENLIRALPGIELLRSEGETMPTLAGHFAVFDTPTEINSVFEGRFIERIAPGAFTKTIREGRDQMRVLFQHGQDPQIGDKVLGPISVLKEDNVGARYEVPLLDTSYNRDLIPGLEAGLYGASFRFKVMQENFVTKPKPSRQNPEGLPERTITEAQVREFGPVTFGAYKEATAGLRSMTDDFLFAQFVDDPDKLLELLKTYKSRRDAEQAEPPANITKDSGASFTVKDELIRVEPEPSEATTPAEVTLSTESEPPAATTRAKAPRAGIYPYREEKPKWLL